MSVQFRAPEEHQKVKREVAFRDTRRFTEVLRDEAPKWDVSIGAVALLTIAPFYNPIFAWVSIPTTIAISLWAGSARPNRSLPMKLPATLSKQTDFNDPMPGQTNKFNKASGTILLGNLRKGKAEVWVTGKDLLTHMLLIGTTGAGKTETLVSLSACTAFCMGGGIIYVDAKAAPKLLFQFATLARIFGREDDIRVINYITGNRAVKERDWERLSNTTNPFAQGTANTAEQTLIGLLPAGGGDNQYFLDRAIAILRTLLPALVELRDKGVLNIYPSLIGEYIAVDKFMALAKNHIEVNGVHYQNIELSERVLKIIRTFLKQLPGFNPNLSPDKQPEEVHRQFGFAEGYFARTLASLAGTYGHIYETELAEADFVDIVMNNRILVVLVPAMEQASEERAALGKIVLSSIRSAMAQGLGGRGEGDYEDVIDSLPIDLRIPTIIIVDEYAEVAVEGFAVTATQGRGLGMSVVFAGQDLAGFVRASEQEADMIFGNTRLKVLMALEDPEITWRKFKELAGSMKVAEGAGWEQNFDGLDTYKTNLSASVREADRINFLDLKEQREGEGHVFERANIHRVQIFHHGISDKKLVKNFRVNRMLKVKNPEPDTVEVLQNKVLRNFELERILEGKSKVSVPHIATLDRLASVRAIADKDKWPWRFLATLDEGISSSVPKLTEANHSGSNTEHPENTNSGDLASSIDMLNEAQSAKGSRYVNSDAGSSANPTNTTPTSTSSNPGVSQHEADDFDGMDMDDLMQEIPMDSDVNDRQVVESADEPGELSERIKRTLAKAENHWIFRSITDEDGISKSERVFNDMVEINTLAGQQDSDAKASVLDAIDGVTDAVVYPSQAIESKPEDVDDLWEALNSLKE
jgi:intracellular multiplication protein IcmO